MERAVNAHYLWLTGERALRLGLMSTKNQGRFCLSPHRARRGQKLSAVVMAPARDHINVGIINGIHKPVYFIYTA